MKVIKRGEWDFCHKLSGNPNNTKCPNPYLLGHQPLFWVGGIHFFCHSPRWRITNKISYMTILTPYEPMPHISSYEPMKESSET